MARSNCLIDFTTPGAIAAWTPLNDTVMGGVSSSRVIEHDGVLRFTGEVSLEHNGGFASMQTDVDLDLHDATGLTLRVRGDGQRYKLGVYDARGRGRIAYRAPFETTEGIWQKIPIRFEDLTPTFRGRTRRDADPLDTSHIRGLSLLISDEQAGPFTLDVAWIEAA